MDGLIGNIININDIQNPKNQIDKHLNDLINNLEKKSKKNDDLIGGTIEFNVSKKKNKEIDVSNNVNSETIYLNGKNNKITIKNESLIKLDDKIDNKLENDNKLQER